MYITKVYVIENHIVGYRLRDIVRYGELPVLYVDYCHITEELTIDVEPSMLPALEEMLARYI